MMLFYGEGVYCVYEYYDIIGNINEFNDIKNGAYSQRNEGSCGYCDSDYHVMYNGEYFCEWCVGAKRCITGDYSSDTPEYTRVFDGARFRKIGIIWGNTVTLYFDIRTFIYRPVSKVTYATLGNALGNSDSCDVEQIKRQLRRKYILIQRALEQRDIGRYIIGIIINT